MTKAPMPFPRVQSVFEKQIEPYRGYLLDIHAAPSRYTIRAIAPRSSIPQTIAVYHEHDDAVAALDRVVKTFTRQPRKCLSCRAGFMSEHAGHRMCEGCRRYADDAGQDYAVGRRR